MNLGLASKPLVAKPQGCKDSRSGDGLLFPVPGDALTNHLWLDNRDKARSGTLRGERYDIEFKWDISNEMPGKKRHDDLHRIRVYRRSI